jgi:hypothetical protein
MVFQQVNEVGHVLGNHHSGILPGYPFYGGDFFHGLSGPPGTPNAFLEIGEFIKPLRGGHPSEAKVFRPVFFFK